MAPSFDRVVCRREPGAEVRIGKAPHKPETGIEFFDLAAVEVCGKPRLLLELRRVRATTMLVSHVSDADKPLGGHGKVAGRGHCAGEIVSSQSKNPKWSRSRQAMRSREDRGVLASGSRGRSRSLLVPGGGIGGAGGLGREGGAVVCADIVANAVEEHIQSAEYVHRRRNCGVDGRAGQTGDIIFDKPTCHI
jgi:hypothetical protein